MTVTTETQYEKLVGFHSDLTLYHDGKVYDNSIGQYIETKNEDNEITLLRAKEGKIYRINISNALKVHFGSKYHNNFRKINVDYIYTNGRRLLDTRTYHISTINDLQRFEPFVLLEGEVVREVVLDGIRYKEQYITNYGRFVVRHGDICFKVHERTYKTYWNVSLTDDNGIQQTFNIHYIVAHTFRKKQYEEMRRLYPNEELEIDHIRIEVSKEDTIHNNHANNLQFVTERQHDEITKRRNLVRKGIEVPQFFENVRVY